MNIISPNNGHSLKASESCDKKYLQTNDFDNHFEVVNKLIVRKFICFELLLRPNYDILTTNYDFYLIKDPTLSVINRGQKLYYN